MTNNNNFNNNNIVAKALQSFSSNKYIQKYILHMIIDKETKQLTIKALFIFYLFMIIFYNQLNLVFNTYVSSLIIFIIIFVTIIFNINK
jgi:hypothetical protein